MQNFSDFVFSPQPVPFKEVLEKDAANKKVDTQENDSSSSGSDSELEVLGYENQSKVCAIVSSPVIFDFCDTDSGKESHLANSSLDDPVNTMLMSPRGSEAYQSPDAVSISSLENGFPFFEKNNEKNGEKSAEKNGNEFKIYDKLEGESWKVQPTEDEVELQEGTEACENSDLSVYKRDGSPLFVSSIDYHHKSIKLDIVNQYIMNRNYERSPARSHSSRSSRASSCSERSSKYGLGYKSRSRKLHSHSASRHTRYSKHRSGRSSHYSKSTRYFKNYHNCRPGLFHKSIPPITKQASELEGFPIVSGAQPNKNSCKEDEYHVDSPSSTFTNNSTTSVKMIAGAYKCPECNYTATLNRVITHYCFRHFTIPCPSCDKQVEEPFFLQHCKYCRTARSKLQCPNCPLTCTGSSLLSLAMHVMCTHPTKKCIACEEDFIPHKFLEHAKSCFFGPNHRYMCPFCECSVAATKLTEHVISHPITECPLCFSDITYHDAEQHMESCYLEKVNDSEESFSGSVFNCPLCQHRFTFENMSHHIVLKHLTLNCVFCYAGMTHDQLVDHVLLCCQQHQNNSEDPKE